MQAMRRLILDSLLVGTSIQWIIINRKNIEQKRLHIKYQKKFKDKYNSEI